jgi:hypothetical protein
MPKSEIPSFACPDFAEAEIGGRMLRFYAISGPVQLRLMQRLGGPLAKAIDALVTDSAAADRQAAIAELVEETGKHATMLGEIILDSLRDEAWAERPAKAPLIEAFLQKVDGAAITAMLAGVVAANVKAFRPFKGLLVQLGASLGNLQPTQAVGAEN